MSNIDTTGNIKTEKRGPMKFIGLQLRVLGMNIPFLLGFAPGILFPFSKTSWMICLFTVGTVLLMSFVGIPTNQFIRWLGNLFAPRLMPPVKRNTFGIQKKRRYPY